MRVAVREGAHGVFLINHDFELERLLPIVREVRERFPSLWFGVNFLAVTGARAFPVLGDLERSGCVVDAYWADDARIDERADVQREAVATAEARRESGWSGLYLGGVAFKKQRAVAPEDFETAARIAARHMDAATPLRGPRRDDRRSAPRSRRFRAGCADQALAVASGVTPDNAGSYAGLVDAVLVATGINRPGNFYDIEPMRLRRLLAVCREAGAGEPEPGPDAGWYLPLMAPNVRGERFAWLDPSSIYINASAFHALVDDLAAPFDPSKIDVVAGFDAMGFVLGSAIATRLGKGFLTISQGREDAGRHRLGRFRELLRPHPADGDAQAGVRAGDPGAARRSVGGDRRHDGRRHPARRASGGVWSQASPPCVSRRPAGAPSAAAGIGARPRWSRGRRSRNSATARRWTTSRTSIPPAVFRKSRSALANRPIRASA